MKNRIASLLFGAASLLAAALPARAETCPAFTYGKVLTAGQWQACFDAKQNVLGYTPLNKAGDTMLGRLVTAPPMTNGTNTAGINLTPGTTPSGPANGDLWITSSGFFARVAGATIGPITGGSAGSFAATLPLSVSFPAGVVTYALNFNSSLVNTAGSLGINLTHSNTFTAEQIISVPANNNGLSIQNSSLSGTKKWILFPFTSSSVATDTCLYFFENSTSASGTRGTWCGPGLRVGDNIQATSTLESAGSFSTPYTNTAKTADYTALQKDSVIPCDATSGNVTITIPAAGSFPGRIITVVKIDSTQNFCSIKPASGTVDGLVEYLNTKKASVTAQARSAGWSLINFQYPEPYAVSGCLPDWGGGHTIRWNGCRISVDQPTAGKPIYDVSINTNWHDMDLLAQNSVGELWGLDTCAAITVSGGTGPINRPQICTVDGSGNVTWTPNATFTGTGSGTNLTVTGATPGTILNNMQITGNGIPVTTKVTIVSQTSGTTGGNGVYVTSVATTSSGDAILAEANTGLYFYAAFCDSGARKGQQGFIASQSWLYSSVAWPLGCNAHNRLVDFSRAWNQAMTGVYGGGLAQFQVTGWPGNPIATYVDWNNSNALYKVLSAGTSTTRATFDIQRYCTPQQDRWIELQSVVRKGSGYLSLAGGSGTMMVGSAVSGNLNEQQVGGPWPLIYGSAGVGGYSVSAGAEMDLYAIKCATLQQ